MAKYRLTAKQDFPGEKIKSGLSITVDVPHDTWINTEIVREALESQLNIKMWCGYNRNLWIIEKL